MKVAIEVPLFPMAKSGFFRFGTSIVAIFVFLALLQEPGRRRTSMKIKIMYENKPTYLEVTDEDCTLMISIDYEDRLSSSEDKDEVKPRSMQEIMDERFNKPDYNNWHKFDRHRGMPKKQFRKVDEPEAESDGMENIADTSYEKTRQQQDEYECLCEVIRKTLKPKQAELIIAVILDGVSVTDYAAQEGVSVSAISHRLETAKKNFKKVFPKSSTFISSQG